MTEFLIGADPEIFVRRNGKAASAYGLVDGTKEKPQPTTYGAVQVDGMALEFNIEPVSSHNFEEFNRNIVRTIADLRRLAGDGINFNLSPTQDFPEELLKAQPKEALELGCDPDFNAYTMKENPKPNADVNFRTAAGHIHVGWGADIPVENEQHMEICAGFVKQLDRSVGMFMTYIDRDSRRRELYGKAGAFRPKSYGVEYRTPSNVWLKNRDRRQFLFNLLNYTIREHTNGRTILSQFDDAGIQNIINEGDHETAKIMLTALFPRNLAWKNVQEEVEKTYAEK